MGNGLQGVLPVLLLFLLGYCLAVIDGELRCYCNESGCVSTGYMCKSSIGICFTSIEDGAKTNADDTRPHTTHGCLDSIPPRHRITCTSSTSPEANVVEPNADADAAATQEARSLLASTRAVSAPILLCCSDHMCNYVEDTAEGNLLNNPTRKSNGTSLQGSSTSDKDKAVSRNQGSNRDDDRDLWFKAAVIAVPIAGGFILVLLVLLAVRMLRTDSRHHRRLIQIRQDRNFTKTQMYISDHFVGKKHQCSLFNEKTGKICSILYPPESSSSSSSCGSSTKPSAPKPICNPAAHKKSPHKHAYVGLAGDNEIYNNKRNIKLKKEPCDPSSTTKTKSPPSAISSSCDNFSNSLSSSNSKNIDGLCCKDHCGKTNSNFSINSNSDNSVCSRNSSPASSQESLHSKGKVFMNNDSENNTLG